MINAIAILFSGSIWLWTVFKKDHYEKEPLFQLLSIALIGGGMSVIPAGFFNSIVSAWFDIDGSPSLVKNIGFFSFVGLNEEFWKAFATIYLIYKHHEFNEPVDGVIYAMTVALGFAVIENFSYISQYGLGILVDRHFVSVPGHIGFAMCWGYGLALAKFKYPERNVWRVVLPYLLVGAALHGLFDVLASTSSRLVLGSSFALVLGLYIVGNKRLQTLLLHSPFRPVGHCIKCQTHNVEEAKFCRQCGSDMQMNPDLFPTNALTAVDKICAHCQTNNVSDAHFCKQCGNAVS